MKHKRKHKREILLSQQLPVIFYAFMLIWKKVCLFVCFVRVANNLHPRQGKKPPSSEGGENTHKSIKKCSKSLILKGLVIYACIYAGIYACIYAFASFCSLKPFPYLSVLSVVLSTKQTRYVRRYNHLWLITYDDCKEVKTLFSFAYIYSWELQYGMSAKKGKEILIANFPLKSG